MGAGQPATQTVPAVRRKLRAEIALAFACWFVMTGVRSAYAVLFPVMAAEPGWNERDLAAAFSIGVLLYAPSTLAAGFLIDRVGTRLPMVAGSTLIALSLGLIATATPAMSWPMWVGWATAAGPGAALIGYTPTIKLLSVVSGANLGRAMGIAMMGQGASPLLIGPAVQALSDLHDWRFAVGAFAVFVLALLLPLILTTAPAPPSQAASSAARFSLAPTNELAHPRAFWLFLFAFFCLGYLLLIPTYLVAYLIETGVATYAAVLAGVFGALNSIGGAVGGGIADRWGFRQAPAFGAALMATGSVALLGVTVNPIWMLGCYLIIAGIGRGIVGVAVTVAHTRTFSGQQFGRITGLLDVGFSIGASLGVWFTLVARDRLGNYTPSLISTAVVCVAIALLVAVGASGPVAGRRPG